MTSFFRNAFKTILFQRPLNAIKGHPIKIEDYVNIVKVPTRYSVKNAGLSSHKTLSKPVNFSTNPNTDYKIEIIQVDDIPQTLDFVREFYHKREPVSRGLNIHNSKDISAIENMWVQVISQGISLKAVLPDGSNKIIGVALLSAETPKTGDHMREIADSVECIKIKRFMNTFAIIHDDPKLYEKFKTDSIVEFSALAVDPSVGARGIGKELIVQGFLLIKDLGYNVCRLDCTSMHVCRFMSQYQHAKLVWALPYSSFVDINGKSILPPDDVHTHVGVYTINLKELQE